MKTVAEILKGSLVGATAGAGIFLSWKKLGEKGALGESTPYLTTDSSSENKFKSDLAVSTMGALTGVNAKNLNYLSNSVHHAITREYPKFRPGRTPATFLPTFFALTAVECLAISINQSNQNPTNLPDVDHQPHFEPETKNLIEQKI